MARIKIQFPESYLFRTTIPVRITDLNYGGHVGNQVLLEWMHEARMQCLAHWGYQSETEGIEGIGLIMADSAIVYRAETFYGDTITIDLAVADVSKVGFDFLYRMQRSADSTLVAQAKTGMVCYDYKARMVNAIPQGLLAKLQQ